MSLIVSELLFCAAIAAALAGVVRRATARAPRPAALTSGLAHPRGAPGGLTNGEVTP